MAMNRRALIALAALIAAAFVAGALAAFGAMGDE